MVPPEDLRFQGTLDSDGELTGFLMRISNGDCKGWLQQVLEHWDEMLETTVPPTMKQDTAPARTTAIGPGTWIPTLLLSCAVLIGIHVGLL
nr:UL16-binding protein 1-like [Mirounga angustirostris]